MSWISQLRELIGSPRTLRRRVRTWVFEKDRRWRGGRRALLRAVLVLVLGLREFHRSRGFERAATLSFATILSLIPAAVLFVSFAGMLGGGERVIDWVEQTLLPKATPEFQDQVKTWLIDNVSRNAFQAANTGLVNVLSIFGLLSAAVLLLTVAERIFNQIWHVRAQRAWLQRLFAFWVILTTSPLVISGSIALEQILISNEGELGFYFMNAPFMEALVGFLLPLAVAFLGVTIFFALLPNTRVRWRSAAVGALATALVWQLTKSAFYLYVAHSANLTNFYGQLASVPLFLVWIYVNWLILLAGANLAFAHQNLFGLMREPRVGTSSVQRSRMYLGLEMLLRRRDVFAGHVEETNLEEEAGELAVPREELLDVAGSLVRIGVLVEDSERPERFVLARSPECIAVSAVAAAMIDEQFPGERAIADPELARPSDIETAAAWGGFLDALSDRSLAELARR